MFNNKTKLPLNIYFSILILSTGLLMLELNLTRIFSVILWYHFAFMAVSLFLLGMSAAGLCLYLFKNKIKSEKVTLYLFYFAVLNAVLTLLIFYIVFNVKIYLRFNFKDSIFLCFIYLLLAIPSFLCGFFISTIVTFSHRNIGKIYFFDLIGAGLGCFLIIPLLNIIGPESTIIVISLLFLVSAILISFSLPGKIYRNTAAVLIVCAALLLPANLKYGFLKIKFVKGHYENDLVYSKWNSYSRVAVYEPVRWLDWGLSDVYEGRFLPGLKTLDIDACAGMVMVGFDGDFSKVEFLKYSITSIGYKLRNKGNIAVLGAGSGKDVLGCLISGAKKIYAVDINPIIKDIVNNRFGDFTGHLYSRPEIKFITADARIFIQKSKKLFSLIQLSMVDTWASTNSGALALAENSLYTVEAFETYLDHLEDEGILTISRFLFDPPRQSLRALTLAVQALKNKGINEPWKHIVIIKYTPKSGHSVSTFLIKKNSFTEDELLKIKNITNNLKFEIIAAPGLIKSLDNQFIKYLSSKDKKMFFNNYRYNIRPTDDNRPFFFYMIKPSKFMSAFNHDRGSEEYNFIAVFILIVSVISVSVMVILFVILPVLIKMRENILNCDTVLAMLYFACLGAGYMLVENSFIQRFILFLGHPIYALSVVLSSLLIFTGIGGFITSYIEVNKKKMIHVYIILLLILISALYNNYITGFFNSYIGLSQPVKIIVSVFLLMPLGLLLGMLFPLGITIISVKNENIIPWMWSINGALSVLGALLSYVISLNFGFRITLYISLFVYLCAMISIQVYRSKS